MGDFSGEFCGAGFLFRLHCNLDDTPEAGFGNWSTQVRLNPDWIEQNHCGFACPLSGGVHLAQGDVEFDS